ncbi:MAG: hypothetical protein AB1521_08455 [Bacteroidota bacterium]
MKKYLFFLLSILFFPNFIIAQIRVDKTGDFFKADLYTLYRASPSSSVNLYVSGQSTEGPNIGRDTINHIEQCGIRVIRFLAEGNVGENPRADRTGDLATLEVTMNNVYQHWHSVYEQSSWAHIVMLWFCWIITL